ncbi:hypothetical protein KIW84_020759 [Lathyrus oleraceus]|uniref:PB1-like domain-containing protein n=1 Tax=Pisum sativum TaxID=3888 RepID=A0A9D4Y6C7_PEA|nr:hypothetical protein KIW84_020759 [Pisum sativum]
MKNSGSQKERNEGVKYRVRPAKTNKIRLRIHHREKLVETPVKWYVNGEVTEMNWSWDVDYMPYMELEDMIKSEGYVNIKCLWYWNLRYSFSRGLRPLNNDQDILQFSKDVVGYDVIDVYVEHGIDEDYVVSDGSFKNNEFQFSEESEESGIDWTKVLPQETLNEVSSFQNKKDQVEMVHDESEDSDHLHTPPGSDHEDERMKYPTYKSGQGVKFQLGVMFTNKEMMWDVVKDYGMENHKNVFIKKNDSKRSVVKFTDGCKFYMRFSKRIGSQF